MSKLEGTPGQNGFLSSGTWNREDESRNTTSFNNRQLLSDHFNLPIHHTTGTLEKKYVVAAEQPVVPVPLYQEVRKKEYIVELTQNRVVDRVVPKVETQDVYHDVPRPNFSIDVKKVRIPRVEFKEKIIEVPVPVSYNYKVVPKWEIRKVPRLTAKYVGKQETIEVEVPQVEIVDKNVDTEYPVFVGEKYVKKEIIEEEHEDTIEYKYVEVEEEIPLIKYKPVLNVEVDFPPPLVVPVAVQPKEVVEKEVIPFEKWTKMRFGKSFSLNEMESWAQGTQEGCQPNKTQA